MNYIVIPEGIAADEHGCPALAPSFVYRQVLDYALAVCRPEDTIFLAPANTYEGKTEHRLAYQYLRSKKPDCRISYPEKDYEAYVDTRGNARHLRMFLGAEWRDFSFDLVCAALHSRRAEYCFRNEGYRLGKVHRVPYVITGERISRRWWYYKYRPLHFFYEALAFARDRLIGMWRRPRREKAP